MTAPARNVFRLPDAVSFDAAAVLTCAGGTAITVMHETAATAGETVVVVGLGPVGLCVALMARASGCRVIGLDVNADRVGRAIELGVKSFAVGNEDPVELIRAHSDGPGADVVAECAGTAKARATALRIARRRGRVAMAGLGDEPDSEPVIAAAIRHDLVIRGIAATPLRLLPSLIESAVHLGFERLISHRFGLADAAAALDLMAGGRCGKVILDVAEAP